MKMFCGVETFDFGEVRKYLAPYCDWDEVMLKKGDSYLPLQLGFHALEEDDWTMVEDLKTALDGGDDSNPFIFSLRAGALCRVVGFVDSLEPTLVVEEF